MKLALSRITAHFSYSCVLNNDLVLKSVVEAFQVSIGPVKLLSDLWFCINCRSNTCSELAVSCADFMWIMEQHSYKRVSKYWLVGESSLVDWSGV